MLLQWQYAPNNNGRVKKGRLKKEAEAAAAAAQPESCKAVESQQSPAKSVCIPINAHADRHLLKWPPSIAPRSRQTTTSAEFKQPVVSRKSAYAEEEAAEHKQPAVHKTSVGEDAHAEAQADEGTIAHIVAWSKQRSPECTEHRKLLSQGLVDLTESITPSPDADNGAAVQQTSPEPDSRAVCHSASMTQPDHSLQHGLHSPEQQSRSCNLTGAVTQSDQSPQPSPAKQQSPVQHSPNRSAEKEDFSLNTISQARRSAEPVTGMPAIPERDASPTAASEIATLPASSLVAADVSNSQLAAPDDGALHEASPRTGRKATTAAQDVTLESHPAEPEASHAAATDAQTLPSSAAATHSAPAAAPAEEQTVSPQAKPALTRLPSDAELSHADVDPSSPQTVLLLEKATRAKLTQTSASVPSGVNEMAHASSNMQAQRSRHMLNLTPEQLALLADRALIGASLLAKDALNIPERHDHTTLHLQSFQGRQQTDTTAMPPPANRTPVHNDTRN